MGLAFLSFYCLFYFDLGGGATVAAESVESMSN